MIHNQSRPNKPCECETDFIQLHQPHTGSAQCVGSGQEPIKMPTDYLKFQHAMRCFAASFVLIALSGCVTETQKVVQTAQATDDKGLPVEVLRVPQQMQDLSGDLLRYHAKHRALPATLEMLLEEKFMTPEQYAALPDYLYSPTDQYKLRDGRVVILVDSDVRVEGHAWCIVREPDGQPRSIQLNVTPISLTELEAAAQRSR